MTWSDLAYTVAGFAAVTVPVATLRYLRRRREHQQFAAEEAQRLRAYLYRRLRRVPGLPADGEPLSRDEWAALDRIEVATLTSLPSYEDGGELP